MAKKTMGKSSRTGSGKAAPALKKNRHGQANGNAPVGAVRIRMYRQGLGDCFLLSFADTQDFRNAAHVLIDCGTLGATTTGVKIADVVADIKATTGGTVDYAAATHEHQDHVSGFTPRNFDDNITFKHVWVAWTENPADKVAQSLEKYHGDLAAAAVAARAALAACPDPRAQQLAAQMHEALSFVGDSKATPGSPGVSLDQLGATFKKTVDADMKYLSQHPKADFLLPGKFLEPAEMPGVRIYVLGPPRDLSKIKNMGEHGDPELYQMADSAVRGFGVSAMLDTSSGGSFTSPGANTSAREIMDASCPFEARYRLGAGREYDWQSAYYEPRNSWRKIDTDWLFGSADFALQLDNLTNNTSLVLAFEIGDGGPVILMAADAQLGSWLSWHDYTWVVPGPRGGTRQVTAKDLLARTVIYKVGHHSSHNATAKEHGLEMMQDERLVCLIPLDKKVATQKKWPMPAEKLYDRLIDKARGRVIRSDVGGPEGKPAPAAPPEMKIVEQPLYFDVILNV